MKLVASSRLRSVEERLEAGRPFGESLLNSIAMPEEEVESQDNEGSPIIAAVEKTVESFATADKQETHLLVVVATDRGLCGGVNSSVSRMVRTYVEDLRSKDQNIKIVTIGEKGRVQLMKDFPEYFVKAFDQCVDKPPTFGLAARISETIVSEPSDYITLFYNKYENAAKFDTTFRHIPQLTGEGEPPESFKQYAMENSSATLQNMIEYGVVSATGMASALYYTFLEAQACETSQRVTAMDNASTNANDMAEKFTLLYNRGRQAKITTELTEIISGAESLEK
ncbi:atpG [Symbiodinium sp. KB8]|nr:atpG [Symbiodinium sp. KB8]